MEFTYSAYEAMLRLLHDTGYAFCNYHNYAAHPRCVILRHDIDYQPEAALRLARVEADFGISSTWFILLTNGLYNPMSPSVGKVLQELRTMGHEIGLHFDESAYESGSSPEQLAENIIKECGLLSALLETEVSSVSMHRPSHATLEADLQVPGIINSYGKTFFRDFKYLSDSRKRWREPVLDIIRSGKYDRLHILTHAFWYHETDEDISKVVGSFICSANSERYHLMEENITDLASLIRKKDVF